MFFRVLSAMVVADAIDRRARRREHGWAAASAADADRARGPRLARAAGTRMAQSSSARLGSTST